MARIVVMEDDAGTRALVAAILRKGGHQVAVAENGQEGLDLVIKHLPDLVVSDVQMPVMTGLEMLAALRASASAEHIPVILLTSLDDRAHTRAGMLQGADDYIPKPCQAAELNEAVNAQLARAAQRASTMQAKMNATMAAQMQQMAQIYERRLAREQAKSWPAATTAKPTDRAYDMASMVFLSLQNLHAFSAALTPEQISEITRNLYGGSSESMRLLGAAHVQFVGEDLLAVYADDAPTAVSSNHFTRAAQAALNMGQAVARCKQFVAQHFASYGLPPLQIGIALHTGPVALTALPDPMLTGNAHIVPVGDAITNVMRLRDGDLPIVWPVMTTQAFLYAAPDLLRLGVSETINLPGGVEVQVHAVVGPGPKLVAQ